MARHGRKATRAWLESLAGATRVMENVYRVRTEAHDNDIQRATNALLLSRLPEAERLARHMRTSAVYAFHHGGTPANEWRVYFSNLLPLNEWRAKKRGERDAQRLVLGVWAHEGRLSVDLAVMIAHLLEK